MIQYRSRVSLRLKLVVGGLVVFAFSFFATAAMASLTFSTNYISSDTGNVGIGTATPSVAMDVAGDVNATEYRQNGVVILRILGATTTSMVGGSIFLGATPTSSLANPSVGYGYSTIIGESAGSVLDNGSFSNTAIGTFAMASTTTGAENVAIGYRSLSKNTTGVENTALGTGALGTGYLAASGNTAVGFNALLVASGTTPLDNVAVGIAALSASVTSTQNTAVGSYALNSNTSGINNTVLGYRAGASGTTAPNTIGSNNLFLGASSGANFANLNNAIAIGANSRVGASNALILGATGANQPNVGIGTSTPFALFTVATSTSNFFSVLASGKVGIATTTPGSQLTVASGDVYVSNIGSGVIFQPAADTCFRLTLSAAGAISTSTVTCP